MGSSHTHQELKGPGALRLGSQWMAIFGGMVALGVAAFLGGLKAAPDRAWTSFLINHFFFMSLAIGALFFVAIQFLTSAMWSVTVRRLAEAMTSYLPLVLVTSLILVAGMGVLYHWTHPEVVAGDIMLEGKMPYLNTPFFIARMIGSVLIWILFARLFVGRSLRQDVTKEVSLTHKNKSTAPVFLILFSITYSMLSFDQMMSVDPHWFSTMFGVYCFAGMFYTTLAMICILAIVLKRQGYLMGFVTDDHLHDLGKFMFAFSVFYAYIAFSQFMLVWYANLPEETGYYLRRLTSEWTPVSIFLVVGKFLAPFFVLLPRGQKRRENVLLAVAVWMLFAHWVDLAWLVQPEFFKEGIKIGWVEIGVTVGFFGLFALAVMRFLSRNSVVAIGDPRLQQSLHHHQ